MTKPKWVDLFGIDPTYGNEELERKREELFEVFKAGYEAATNWYQGQAEDPHDHDDDDVRQAFEEWLDGQFAEVDPWAGDPEPRINQEEFYQREEAKPFRVAPLRSRWLISGPRVTPPGKKES